MRHPLSTRPPYAIPMRHPFQTDTFDPGDPALVTRVYKAKRLHDGFRIGGTAYELDGARWIHLHNPYCHPLPYTFTNGFFHSLVYPMPESYGVDPYEAMNAFERHWNAERVRLWALEPPPPAPEPLPMPPPPCPALPRPRKAPKGRLVALAGAVPIPGLEWTVFGRIGGPS
jgi:hypothetical protein